MSKISSNEKKRKIDASTQKRVFVIRKTSLVRVPKGIYPDARLSRERVSKGERVNARVGSFFFFFFAFEYKLSTIVNTHTDA